MTYQYYYRKCLSVGLIATYSTVLYTPFANAAIYKWVDSAGNTYYSDEQPKDNDVSFTKITVRKDSPKRSSTDTTPETSSTNTSDTKAQSDTPANATEQTTSTSQAQENTAAKRKQTNITDAKQRRCEQGRTDFAILSQSIPVYLNEAEQYRLNWAGDTYTGERNYLDDEGRETALEKAKTVIKEYCRNPDDDDAQSMAHKKWARSEYCTLNQTILTDLQRTDIKASERQLNKQRKLVDKYCNTDLAALAEDDSVPEIFPRQNR